MPRPRSYWFLQLCCLICACAPGKMAKPPAQEPARAEVASPTGGQPRMVARSARVKVYQDKPAESVSRASDMAKQSGGWVERTGDADVVLRIPDEQLETFIGRLGELGKLANKSLSGEDVTELYLDAKIRLENLESFRRHYLDLLQKAQSVSDSVMIEKELERVTGELEALKGKLKYLETTTAFARVEVEFSREVVPGPVGWVFYGLFHGVKWLFIWD